MSGVSGYNALIVAAFSVPWLTAAWLGARGGR